MGMRPPFAPAPQSGLTVSSPSAGPSSRSPNLGPVSKQVLEASYNHTTDDPVHCNYSTFQRRPRTQRPSLSHQHGKTCLVEHHYFLTHS